MWEDMFLSWTPGEQNGTSNVVTSSKEIWLPEVYPTGMIARGATENGHSSRAGGGGLWSGRPLWTLIGPTCF